MANRRGILALPNEVLLSIFNSFPSHELLPFATTCKHVHSLVLRLLCHRLNIATSLGGYTLYVECDHPSTKPTTERLFCTSLGTEGLQELFDRTLEDPSCVDQIGQLQKLYTRFRPQRREPEIKLLQRHPAGDVPGSRTYVDRTSQIESQEPEDVVMDTVTVEANCLFTQLTTVAYLGKREPVRGRLWSIHTVIEGTVRVWRDWLSKQCQSRTFSDHSTVDIQYEPAVASIERLRNHTLPIPDPKQDPSILWLNTRDHSLGLKLKVKSQRRRLGAAPLLYQNELELPVSYIVHFDEIVIRTWRLLLQLEEAQQQMVNDSGRAIVFGSYSGVT